jgi:hypothetical protein
MLYSASRKSLRFEKLESTFLSSDCRWKTNEMSAIIDDGRRMRDEGQSDDINRSLRKECTTVEEYMYR